MKKWKNDLSPKIRHFEDFFWQIKKKSNYHLKYDPSKPLVKKHIRPKFHKTGRYNSVFLRIVFFWYPNWYLKNTILGCVGVLTNEFFWQKMAIKMHESRVILFFSLKNNPKNTILGCVGVLANGFFCKKKRKKTIRAG